MTTASEQLARLPVFSTLTPSEFEILKPLLKIRALEPLEPLFEEGDVGRSCYVVLSGRIGVYKSFGVDNEEKLAVLRPGSLFGEMALIDNRPRSASCRAELQDRTTVIEFDRDTFDRLFHSKTPFAFKILDQVAMGLAERLRSATLRFIEAKHDTLEAARWVAAALTTGDTEPGDLEDLDVDSITFEIPTLSQRMLDRR